MNNEYQGFCDVAVGVIGVLGGWVLNTVWGAVKDLQAADKENLIFGHRCHLAIAFTPCAKAGSAGLA
jgi:hypothetical protein